VHLSVLKVPQRIALENANANTNVNVNVCTQSRMKMPDNNRHQL